MEYLIVRYHNSRLVYVDGQDAGETARMLFVEEGHHVFDLGEPRDYEPPELEVDVTGTTSIDPLELVFTPRGGSGGQA